MAQAVHIRRWPGNGLLSQPWGKLKQDPELWDDHGDAVIHFAHRRSDPSFRIQSSLLRNIGSEVLIDMLLIGTVREGSSLSGVSHKLYMDAPSALTAKEAVLRHHLATRNFIAFLQQKPLVGMTLYEALTDLQVRLERYYANKQDCEELMKAYLVSTGLVNVSNEPRAALGLLAWSEDIRWHDGWREAFVHSVGMYDRIIQEPEMSEIRQHTRAYLDRAHLDLSARLHEAEEDLADFCFEAITSIVESLPQSTRSAAERFCKFLKKQQEKQYHRWPPRTGKSDVFWLDRSIVGNLQEDFGALYEYLVDQEEGLGDRPDGKKAAVVMSMSHERESARRELAEQVVKMLQNIDKRAGRSSIPHPFPLLPADVPAAKKSALMGKRDKARESKVAHSFASASNACRWGHDHGRNELVQRFKDFEATDHPSDIDPCEARIARWTVIYCILQVLAGISVDVPQLSFKTDVRYFLNARLEDLPPWKDSVEKFPSPSREQSHCWTSPHTWDQISQNPATKASGTDSNDTLCKDVKHLSIEESSSQGPLRPERFSKQSTMRGSSMLDFDGRTLYGGDEEQPQQNVAQETDVVTDLSRKTLPPTIAALYGSSGQA